MVRLGAVFGSALALALACSSKTVDLNKGGGKDKGDGAVGSSDSDSGTGGTGATGGDGTGSVRTDAGQGSLSTTPGVLPNKPSTLKKSNKLDLLFMIDNSISMADKQKILSSSMPDLVQRISDPSSGFTDLHVGVITSSIGGHGADLCKGSDTSGNIEDQEENDHAYLMGTRPRFDLSGFPGALAPTPQGFLAWTPDMGTTGLVQGVSAMVSAAGEFGCGLESQLEAVQRFLVDPNPYQEIVTQNCPGSPMQQCAVKTGKDMNLLAQRQAFLRPDSVVAIVELTDENDCSIREDGQYYYAARNDIVLPHGSSACATNPNDRCCYFCGSSPPAGCFGTYPDGGGPSAGDPACATATLPSQDQPNLRCFHQKERFGMDFLYPVERYINALTKTQICTSSPDLSADPSTCKDLDGDKHPDILDNPLFVNGDTVRDPSMVYFLGVLGVPYQDLTASSTATSITYQTPAQLVSNGTWDKVLGNDDPGNYAPPVLPTDSLMVESTDPRGGNDGQGDPLAATDAAQFANPVNGHEVSYSTEDDLQYSCIFKLPTARNCAAIQMETPQPGCDCSPNTPPDNNPLCQNGSAYTNTQFLREGISRSPRAPGREGARRQRPRELDLHAQLHRRLEGRLRLSPGHRSDAQSDQEQRSISDDRRVTWAARCRLVKSARAVPRFGRRCAMRGERR
ncbi:MAG TPA: hypothetical protein VH062_33935 [Polyangiaceae bacterium]|nr:hypothetical protein [Polyangiaceae bacterium]